METDALPDEALLSAARDQQLTPFEYVIVGSGAGGGPLAARLALAGKRVLVIESGNDPAARQPAGTSTFEAGEPESWREVYKVPVYYAAASEDAQMGWEFSVRHYADNSEQAKDVKYDPARDPSRSSQPGKGGILYPRCSALGGCTSHHAMIVVKPNDRDWDRIAELTGDESWQAGTMQGYFARLERCLYYTDYDSVAQKLLGALYLGVRWLVELVNPRLVLDRGQHGTAGWQTTSFIGPPLIDRILRGDFTFVRLLLGALKSEFSQRGVLGRFLRALLRFQWLQFFDPNFRSADGPGQPSVMLIPIGTDGSRRDGLREHLLRVATLHPERLTLLTDAHATRVVFAAGSAGSPPRAVGVEVARGTSLYAASPRHDPAAEPPGREVYFAKEEVILSGGTFNTPQLLMLSGIGDAAHLRKLDIDGLYGTGKERIADVVDLPGVGGNMQDRYEVSVISEASDDFSVLRGASFLPGDPEDPARLEWLAKGTGLYATNGGSLALFLTSEGQPVPDLFVFGVPAAFRGYYWNWSKELLRPEKGSPTVQRNLWSWVILKAYTHNNGGTVRLLSASPFAQPEIVFNSFATTGSAGDLAALELAIRRMREINWATPVLKHEIQPGTDLPDGSQELRDWLRTQTWGHHACGTCRMGADSWRADVADLTDKGAVIDSKFRVHGVRGLRVVDASVFPYIPGYFIVTPVFMIGEKAADTLIADAARYPHALEAAEAAAIRRRREVAMEKPSTTARGPWPETALPADVVGLALSGGGIRSATYSLGALQALAAKGRLRGIDFLSTVSGGGYIGAFLGRLFSRKEAATADKVGRIEEIVKDVGSAEVWWLRTHANYLGGGGPSDLETNLGAIWRNLLAVQLALGVLAVALLGALRWVADQGWAGVDGFTPGGVALSPWWRLLVAELLVGLAPAWFGFWLAPKPGTARSLSPSSFPLWIVLLATAIAALRAPGSLAAGLAGLCVLLLAWAWLEVVGWRMPPGTTPETRGVIVRNRLTRAAGGLLLLFGASALWVGVDTVARQVASDRMLPMASGGSALFASALALASRAVAKLASRGGGPRQKRVEGGGLSILLAVIAGSLLTLIVLGLDVLVHSLFDLDPALAAWTVLLAAAVSVSIGRAIGFVNLSSLCATYAARLARTFLGASNDARVHPGPTDDSLAVQVPHPGDDLPLSQYHPERNGGPLHLINVCITQTVDFASGRQLADDRSLQMCVGPEGVSVGERYHALWEGAALRALPVAPDPYAFHVLARGDRLPVGSTAVKVEALRLSEWTAISGAALATGSGSHTRLSLSLLLGLFNVRLGYWWDSGINAGERPGRYPPTFWRRLKGAPAWVLRAQSMLLDEWRGYFRGPSERFWYLSDGGNVDGSGLYELIRRRLPFMIAVDSGYDPDYQFDNLAAITRLARLDLGAQISWIDPGPARLAGDAGWDALAIGAPKVPVPRWIQEWVNPDALGCVEEIGHGSTHSAALARITYAGSERASWLLLLKASLTPAAPFEVREFAAAQPTFPNRPTSDQFFDGTEWESYRQLGESSGRRLFR